MIISTKGRGFINQGSTLLTSKKRCLSILKISLIAVSRAEGMGPKFSSNFSSIRSVS